jgi:tRNA (cmo5U34)-methyltransferase
MEIANRVVEANRGQPTTETLALEPFGRLGAARYDVDAFCMPCRYKRAHKIQNDLIIDALRKATAPGPIVLDLGCGTANDGLYILSKTNSAIYFGLDYSSHMIKRAKNKLGRHRFAKRSLLIERDFRLVNLSDLCASLTNASLAPELSAVISALALHHYELAEKGRVYQLVHDFLPRGGLFVLTDLFSNAIQVCAEQALRKEIVDIRRTVRRFAQPHVQPPLYTTLSERHYIDVNRPQILADEIACLSNIGFKKLDLVYRSGQLGVIAAQK